MASFKISQQIGISRTLTRRRSRCPKYPLPLGRDLFSSILIRTVRFDDFIKDLASQFERWNLGGLYKQCHVAKVMPCNWKIAQEAFCEAYHVNATHPQVMRSIGDVNSQVDIWENCARVITPGATHSPLLDSVSNDDLMRQMMDLDHDAPVPQVPDGFGLVTSWLIEPARICGPSLATALTFIPMQN